MPAPTLIEVKRLFARSRNRCAFPNCESPITEDSGAITGEMCHIKAASPGGPRYDKTQTEAERHASSNLILLCGRHHKLIDTEPNKYTPVKIAQMKYQHEQGGIIEITPSSAKAATALLDNYTRVVVNANTGQIAIHSPGAIQANTINLKITKAKVTVAPPTGSIAENRAMMSYAKYLIDRYQKFQKADYIKTDRFKYIAIHEALKRQFKGDWKLSPTSRFDDIVVFLQKRIDNTIVGRKNKVNGSSSYHKFEEHK